MLYVCLRYMSRLHLSFLLLPDLLDVFGVPHNPTPPPTRRSWSLLVAQQTDGHCLKYLVPCIISRMPITTSYDCAVQFPFSSTLDDFQCCLPIAQGSAGFQEVAAGEGRGGCGVGGGCHLKGSAGQAQQKGSAE